MKPDTDDHDTSASRRQHRIVTLKTDPGLHHRASSHFAAFRQSQRRIAGALGIWKSPDSDTWRPGGQSRLADRTWQSTSVDPLDPRLPKVATARSTSTALAK